MVSSTPWPNFTPGKDPVLILQEAGWAPRAGMDGRKISFLAGLDPGPSNPSQELYRYEVNGKGQIGLNHPLIYINLFPHSHPSLFLFVPLQMCCQKTILNYEKIFGGGGAFDRFDSSATQILLLELERPNYEKRQGVIQSAHQPTHI